MIKVTQKLHNTQQDVSRPRIFHLHPLDLFLRFRVQNLLRNRIDLANRRVLAIEQESDLLQTGAFGLLIEKKKISQSLSNHEEMGMSAGAFSPR